MEYAAAHHVEQRVREMPGGAQRPGRVLKTVGAADQFANTPGARVDVPFDRIAGNAAEDGVQPVDHGGRALRHVRYLSPLACRAGGEFQPGIQQVVRAAPGAQGLGFDPLAAQEAVAGQALARRLVGQVERDRRLGRRRHGQRDQQKQ